jgi:Holliday junction resolvase RusA-like endonuclease
MELFEELVLELPGSIRQKKNSKQIITIPAKGTTKIFQMNKNGGMRCVRPIPIPSKAYSAWEEEAKHEAMQQLPKGWCPLAVPVWVECHFYYKGAEPDLSGSVESIGDCLEHIVWKNDRQIKSWDKSRKYHDKANPRTMVFVRWKKEAKGGVVDADVAKKTMCLSRLQGNSAE